MILYIDPGTGSMLFSVAVGVAATLYFSLRSLVMKLKTNAGSKAAQQQSEKAFVLFCESQHYYNIFHPIAREFEKRKIEVSYFTTEEDDPLLSENLEYVKPQFIGKGNKAYAKLNFLSAAVVLMTTPGLDVYQLKRSKRVGKYIHIVHMPTDATSYRLFGLDYFDSVLLSGDYQGEDLRTLEEKRGTQKKDLVTVGCVYLDEFAKKVEALPEEENHKFTVLLSPSWGETALLSKYGEKLLDPLSESGMQIIVRPHPQSSNSEKDMLDRLMARYADNERVEWDFARENLPSLKRSDIMISDFSGIIFDYTFLFSRPVIYVPGSMDQRAYDSYDVERPMWMFRSLEKFGLPLKEEQFEHIGEVIRDASDSESLKQAREQARKEAWMYPGEAAKRTVDYMISEESKN